jgi:hypothetical protein
VVAMMMVMMVMMVVMRRAGRRSDGRLRRRRSRLRRRGGFLRDGVSRQSNGEKGGGDNTLDHEKGFLLLNGPRGSSSGVVAHCA